MTNHRFRHRETRPTTNTDYYKILIDFVRTKNVFSTGYAIAVSSADFTARGQCFDSRGGLWAPKIITHIIVKILLHIIYLFKPFEAYWNPHKQTVKGLTQSKRLFAQSWWRDFGLLVSTGNTTPGALSLSYKPEFFIVTFASLLLKDILRKTTSFAKAPLSQNMG